MRRFAFVPVLSLVAAGCAHEPTAPVPARGATIEASTFIECPPNNTQILPDDCQIPGSGGWAYFGMPDDGLFPAANDPFPTAQGIWLGDTVTAATCYADQNRAIMQSGALINDKDKDWLADNCEYDLAYAFAPRLLFTFVDPCPFGEPYWAAKYFPKTGIVRIAYLPAYWDDCGDPILGFYGNEHSGDSEYILLEVAFDGTTRHWVFRQMWLSAHNGESTDHSEWVSAFSTEFKYRPASRPNVWVADRKHANYKNYASCTHWTFINDPSTHEICGDPTGMATLQPIRFPIKVAHNLGSRFQGTQCVPSEVAPRQTSGRTECFYTYRTPTPSFERFCGWTVPSMQYGGCASNYYGLLTGDKFENKSGDVGPGPNAPVFTATIAGPPAVEGGSLGSWSASTFAGFAPYTYSWSVNGMPAGTGPTIEWGIDAGATYQISLVVRDALGHSSTALLNVVGTGSGGCIIC